MRRQLADNKQLMDCMDVSKVEGSAQDSVQYLAVMINSYMWFLHFKPMLEHSIPRVSVQTSGNPHSWPRAVNQHTSLQPASALVCIVLTLPWSSSSHLYSIHIY